MVCITVSSLTSVQSQVRGRGGKSEGEVVCIIVLSPTSVQSQVRGRGGMYNSFVSYKVKCLLPQCKVKSEGEVVCITVSSPTSVKVKSEGEVVCITVSSLTLKVKSEGEVVCITVLSLTLVQSEVRGRGGMYNSFVSYLSTKSSQRERWYV